MAVDVVGQAIKGNSDIWGTLGRGLVDSIDNIIWGTLSRMERDLNKSFMSGKKWPMFSGPLDRLGFTPRVFPRTAGVTANTVNTGSVTGLTSGNVFDNLFHWIGDYNDGKFNR
jgi:hypothetical protein